MKSGEKLTLYKALRYVGFESRGPRTIGRGNVTMSLRIGDRPHYYTTTPLGIADYQSQRKALHALIGYRLIHKNDLEKMASLGYAHAKEELSIYDKTITNFTYQITAKERCPAKTTIHSN
jgi:hypothetical protein